MKRLISNAVSLLKHSEVRAAYRWWLGERMLGRDAFVPLPRSGRGYAGNKFNDFYGIWVQHPGEAELRTFELLLDEGGVYVDVGANMGLTCVVAWNTGKVNRILGFEPTHRYAAIWHRNVEENGVANATLFQCLVGDRSGVEEFIVNPHAPMHNRFRKGASLNRYAQSGHDPSVITAQTTVRLDAVCSALAIDEIALLKVDVEGAEPMVLRGAEHLLAKRKIRSIYLEFIPEFMSEMGEDVAQFVAYFEGFGYCAFSILEDGTLGAHLSQAQLLRREFSGLNIALRPA